MSLRAIRRIARQSQLLRRDFFNSPAATDYGKSKLLPAPCIQGSVADILFLILERPEQMAQSKKNIARWVLQGICVLGILSGFLCVMAGVTMLLALPTKDDIFGLCFLLGFMAIMLVVGAWLARDCYRMLRGRSFEAIRSISAILALMPMSWIIELLPEERFIGEGGSAGHFIAFAVDMAPLVAFLVVYFACKKLLTRLRKAAQGPEEPSETPHPAG